MSVKILPHGKFSVTIGEKEIQAGLRPINNGFKNTPFLTQAEGVVGLQGLLQTCPNDTQNSILDDPLIISDDFPFPQFFITDALKIVCNRTSILEIRSGVLVSCINSLTTGDLWEFASNGGFVYFSNGVVTVIRDIQGSYSVSSDYPVADTICNFNGQILIGSPK
jgi:hypothetical protein